MVAYQFGLPAYYTTQAWVVLGLCSVVYWLTGTLTIRFKGTENFGNAMMAAKAIRMLLAAVGFFIYVFNKGEYMMQLAVVLLICYLSYSAFEIRTLLPNLQSDSEQPTQKN